MRYRSFLAAVALCAGLAAQTTSKSAFESVYTNLSGQGCKLVVVKGEGANSTQDCPGVGGYRLLVLDSDSRQSVTIIDPSGRKWPLNLWHIISRSFSTLGPRAEWRVTRTGKDVAPAALIVRVKANESADSSAETSYLSVAKIAKEETCVVARIKPSANANSEARAEADRAAAKPCLKELE